MKLIPLEEVEKLIKNKMKELHELRKEPGILPKDAYTAMMVGVDEIREELGSLPTIDFFQIIDEMIEERIKKRIKIQKRDPIRRLGDDICTISIPILQELKSRLSLTKK